MASNSHFFVSRMPRYVTYLAFASPETLLDLVRTCTVFMDVGKVRAKIVARYQQYRALCKIITRFRNGNTPEERSGVVWHTQGSGKSLTMVFLIRKIRMCDDLKDFKICLVNDRTDLEKQLGETAELTGEKVSYITSSAELKSKLSCCRKNGRRQCNNGVAFT